MGKKAPEKESSSTIGKLFSTLIFIGAPLFAFWTLAALLVSQGLSRLVAGPIAGTLLVLPLLWHLLGERKRKKAEKPKGGLLSGRDRFGLRVVVVAGVALAVMFGLFRGKTTRALKTYADWPLHAPASKAKADSSAAGLIALLPPRTSRVGIIDLRVSLPGEDWKRVVRMRLPEPLRGLEFETVAWSREVGAIVSSKDMVAQVDALAKADGKELKKRGQGRYWSRWKHGAAFASSQFMVWGADITWVEKTADGERGTGNAKLIEAAKRVPAGAGLLIVGDDNVMSAQGEADAVVAVYPASGGVRIEMSVRFGQSKNAAIFEGVMKSIPDTTSFLDFNKTAAGRKALSTVEVRRLGDNIVNVTLRGPASLLEPMVESLRWSKTLPNR